MQSRVLSLLVAVLLFFTCALAAPVNEPRGDLTDRGCGRFACRIAHVTEAQWYSQPSRALSSATASFSSDIAAETESVYPTSGTIVTETTDMRPSSDVGNATPAQASPGVNFAQSNGANTYHASWTVILLALGSLSMVMV